MDVEAVREVSLSWTRAVERGDLQALAGLMSDDIVVIHGDGRAVSGKEAVVADLARSLLIWRAEQRVASEETIIAGNWAFDRARVSTTLTPVEGGPPREFRSRTVTLLCRGRSGKWAVARVIGVVEQEV